MTGVKERGEWIPDTIAWGTKTPRPKSNCGGKGSRGELDAFSMSSGSKAPHRASSYGHFSLLSSGSTPASAAAGNKKNPYSSHSAPPLMRPVAAASAFASRSHTSLGSTPASSLSVAGDRGSRAGGLLSLSVSHAIAAMSENQARETYV